VSTLVDTIFLSDIEIHLGPEPVPF